MIAQLDKGYLGYGIGPVAVRLLSYAFFEGRPITTRGRWMNPVVFGISSLCRRLPQLKSVEKPIFIVGMGRSGTTILGVTLSLHRSVGFLNEPKALWHSACPSEDVIGNYASESSGRFLFEAGDANDRTTRDFHRLYGAYLRLTGRTRILDKYPEAIFRIPFILSMFPDSRIIWLVRKGDDVIASVRGWGGEHARVTESGTESWWGVEDRKWKQLVVEICPLIEEFTGMREELLSLRSDSDRAAVEWTATCLFGQRFERQFPDSIMRVNYESLASDPAASIHEVLDFCGLDADERVTKFATSRLRPVQDHDRTKVNPRISAGYARAMHEMSYSHG